MAARKPRTLRSAFRAYASLMEQASTAGPSRTGAAAGAPAMALANAWGQLAELLSDGVPAEERTRAGLARLFDQVLFQWARSVREKAYDAGELAEYILQDELPLPRDDGFPELAVLSMRMSAGCGRVYGEMLSQQQDERMDADRLKHALTDVVVCWARIAGECGLDWKELFRHAESNAKRRPRRPRNKPG